MTLNYNQLASTSTPWRFLKLLFTWKASIWKAVYLELLCYLLIYSILSSIYRFAMNSSQQRNQCRNRNFEDVVRFFNRRLDFIPLELVLGFFCTQVFNRWTKQYQNIGFIDK
ncbi:hypothetical protein ANCDUO_08808 [Ancylostoma duodenale]|uniref:Bestrophin homolog n=1 Tax=Ancylostoma duodenale TaxID=51022 RepID=A0A0C2DEV2_9BILA|nr:hypothetical protein ANCDUO_08808 [Ancylostoma duodenale]